MSYVEVAGTHNYGTSWQNGPLIALAKIYGVSAFRVPISLGAMVSFFGLTLTCLNAGARIIYRMAGHDVLPKPLSRAHPHNRTPHISITVYIAMIVTVPLLLEIFTNPSRSSTTQGLWPRSGSSRLTSSYPSPPPCSSGSVENFEARHIAVAVAAFLCLLVPTVGTFYPVPAWPVDTYPYIFLGYMLLGGTWLYVANRRRSGVLGDIALDLAKDPTTLLSALLPNSARPGPAVLRSTSPSSPGQAWRRQERLDSWPTT